MKHNEIERNKMHDINKDKESTRRENEDADLEEDKLSVGFCLKAKYERRKRVKQKEEGSRGVS